MRANAGFRRRKFFKLIEKNEALVSAAVAKSKQARKMKERKKFDSPIRATRLMKKGGSLSARIGGLQR